MITFTVTGDTRRTQDFLRKMQTPSTLYSGIDAIAQRGVDALRAATPMDSGLTAASWGYEIEITNEGVTITWINTNNVDGVNVAVILQYGHGTGTGGYVAGRDYINGAIQPIFDQIADDIWKKVTSA